MQSRYKKHFYKVMEGSTSYCKESFWNLDLNFTDKY